MNNAKYKFNFRLLYNIDKYTIYNILYNIEYNKNKYIIIWLYIINV